LELPPLEQVEVSAEAEPVEEEPPVEKPVDELEMAEVEAAEESQEPAPFEPVALDQRALEAEVEAADLAPDESFDTLEARKAQPLDFAAEDVISAPETFAEAPPAPQAEAEREAETEAVEFEEPLVTPGAEQPAEESVESPLAGAEADEMHFTPELATPVDVAGEAALADTIVGEQTPVFELEEPPAVRPIEETPAAEGITEATIEAFGEPPIALEPTEPPSGEGAALEIPSSTEPAMPLEIEAEALETAPAQAADEIEVLEHTEATPESALPLAREPGPAPQVQAAVEEVELTDTGFGRAVEELSAESKPIVEEVVEPSAAGEAEPVVEEVAPLAELEEEPIVEGVAEPLSAADPTAGATIEPPERFTAPGAPPRAINDELALDLLSSEPVASGEADELMVEIEQPPAERVAEAPGPLLADETVAPQAEEKLFDRDAIEHAAHVAEQPPADLNIGAAADALAIEEPGVGAGDSRDTLGEWGVELEPEEEAAGEANVPPVTSEPVEPTEPPPPPRSRLAPGASRLDLEPILDSGDDSGTLGEPLEVREDELELEPIAEAPPPAGDAPAAPTEPGEPRPAPPVAGGPQWAGVAPFNWGANQEHFLGGMPLKLGGGSAPSTPATPLPRPPLAAPAATRQPLTDDSISMSGPAIADRPRMGRPQPMPAQRPGPRRGQTSPFAGGEARGPQVTTGFDGLAMPPVRETDVFAPMPGSLTAGFAPGLMDDVFGGNARRTMPTPQPQVGGGGAGATIPPGAPASDAARRPQPRRATNAQPPGEAWSPERSAANAPEADLAMVPTAPPAGSNRPPAQAASAPPPAPPRKKRRWFGFRMLLLFLALPCAVGAAAGAYYLIPNKSSVRGELKFVNFDRLPQKERVELAQQQKKLIADERLRSAARNKLSSLNSQLTPGFLGGGLGLARVQSSANMDMESGTLTLPLAGASGRADQTRMFALLQAMYDANTERAQAANQLTATLETLTRERAQRTRGLEELKQRIDQLAAAAQSAPDAAERKRLETEAERLRKSWDEAIVVLKDLSAQVKDLEANRAPAAPATTAAVASTAPGEVNPAASLADKDAELARLQQALKQVDQRISAVQEGGASAGLAVVTRLFEDALAAFDRQLVQAVAVAKENTPFQAYLDNAKQLSDQANERSVAFFKRQEAQYAKLAEAQANLDEKQLARRAELSKRDPEMVKLLDQKDLKTRQYNTALAQNLSKEAAEIKTELNFLDSMITARQTQVADDGFFADAIDQLQRIVEGTRKQIADDQTRTAREMEELAAALARSRPEELSSKQKDLAQQLERGFGEMVAARAQYADAAEAASKEAGEQVKTLRVSADELLGKIQARKAELAEAEKKLAEAKSAQPATDQIEDRDKLLAQKKSELAAAQQRHDDAKAAYLAANDKLAKLGEQVGRATAAGEERDRLLIQRDTDQRDLDQKILHYESKKKEAELLAYPAIPSESDVKSDEAPDKRPIYSLAAFGGVAALFALGIMLSGGGREASSTRMGDYRIGYGTEEPVESEADADQSKSGRPVEV
jgi:hypothetical protein